MINNAQKECPICLDTKSTMIELQCGVRLPDGSVEDHHYICEDCNRQLQGHGGAFVAPRDPAAEAAAAEEATAAIYGRCASGRAHQYVWLREEYGRFTEQLYGCRLCGREMLSSRQAPAWGAGNDPARPDGREEWGQPDDPWAHADEEDLEEFSF